MMRANCGGGSGFDDLIKGQLTGFVDLGAKTVEQLQLYGLGHRVVAEA
jgi:hypothetical protein